MSSSQSSQFPPKSIVKNKSYEGVETLRQIASTSLYLDKEQKSNATTGSGVCQTIPTINEPTDEGSTNASLINLMPQSSDATILEPPIEMMMKMDTLKVDTLNVIDIISLTDSETDREIRQIDINQEVVIPRIEPTSLFSDDNSHTCDVGDGSELVVDDESQLDSEAHNNINSNSKRSTINKLHRQRTSLNQSKVKESDTLLMETSLMIIDPAPLSPPPFSPPPLPISPNIVTTTSFNIPSTLSLSLPLTNTTSPSNKDAGVMDMTGESSQRKHRSHHHHSHHHHRHGHRHKHSSRTDGGIKDSHQVTEAELVLSPSKLGQ